MLVTFESSVGRVTLFGDVAVQLLRMMGHSGTIPSALLAGDVSDALARLQRALAAADPGEEEEEAAATPTDDREARVSLRNRAFPLIRLLEDAIKARSDILWEQEGSAPLKF